MSLIGARAIDDCRTKKWQDRFAAKHAEQSRKLRYAEQSEDRTPQGPALLRGHQSEKLTEEILCVGLSSFRRGKDCKANSS